MPGGSKYQGPIEKLEQYADVVAESNCEAEVKGAKNPYTSRNGHMFSFLSQDGTMALRLPHDLTDEFRARYVSGDVEQYGATMRGYSSVPPDLLAQTDELVDWFDKSWDWIGTLPPKSTKK